jgi:uncharacterized protein (TIGR03083 family)
MVDDSDLDGLDPYELMAGESVRLDRYFSGLGADDWSRASRCEGWSIRDVLAHLAWTEDYKRACLDGRVAAFLGEVGAKGGTDIATANEIGIREFDDRSPEEVLDSWRTTSAATLAGFRERDGKNVDTTVGDYPARWQAFHLAFELATHADDVYAPVDPSESSTRIGWQVKFGRFALEEAKPAISVESQAGRTHVRAPQVDVEVDDATFVAALAARLPATSPLDAEAAAAISVTP